jgi:hypothetical protein
MPPLSRSHAISVAPTRVRRRRRAVVVLLEMAVRGLGLTGWPELTRQGAAAWSRAWRQRTGSRRPCWRSGRFSPSVFLPFLSVSNRAKTSFLPQETISTISSLFLHLLAAMSLFLLMWHLIY